MKINMKNKNSERGFLFFHLVLYFRLKFKFFYCFFIFLSYNYSMFGKILFFLFLIFSPFLSFSSPIAFVNIEVIGSNPMPGNRVDIYLDSVTFDLDTSENSFYLNGKLFDKGIGLKKINIEIKDFKPIEIKVESLTMDGQLITGEKILYPAGVDIVYELNNPYRPINYKGKSYAVSSSALTLYAFPDIFDENGRRYSNNNLVYEWFIDTNLVPEASGFGKDKLEILNLRNYPVITKIELVVRTPDNKVSTRKMIELKPKKVVIKKYLKNPAHSYIYNSLIKRKVKSTFLETNILAVPYFVNKDDDFELKWFINDKEVSVNLLENENYISILNSTEEFVSRVFLRLNLNNNDKILQSAQKTIEINFDFDELGF